MAEGFTPGIYTLFNKSAGKVVEFQPKDGSVSAGTFRPGKTQQEWEIIPVNGNFAIRCMLPATDGHRVYLSLGGDMRDGQAVRAESHPLLWRVSRRDDMIRLFFTNNFCLDLDDHSHHKIHIVQCKEHEGLSALAS